MRIVSLLAIVLVMGCADKRFVDVGNNVMVSKSSVAERARQQGITFDEALQEMRAEAADAESELMVEARRKGILFDLADLLEDEDARKSRRGF